MAAPVPRFYDATDTTLLTALSFTGLLPGTPSDWQEIHLWNNKGGAGSEPITNGFLRALGRPDSLSPWVSEGLDVIDFRAIEVRVIGGAGVGPFLPTGARGIGAGATFDLPDVGNDETVHLEVRINPPAGVDQPEAIQVAFRVESARYEPLPTGVYEVGGSFVRLGIGDGDSSQLLVWAGAEESGTPDDDVQFPDLVWIWQGVPYCELAHAENLDGNDGDAAALSSGEAYAAIFAANETIEVSKGSKDTAPLTSADDPIPPVGLPLTRVVREFDGSIEQADITDLSQLSAFGIVSIVGRVITLGGGEAIVGPSRVRLTTDSSVTAPASQSSTIWVLPTAGLEADDERPDPRAMALYEVTCDASNVTAIRDVRNFGEQLSQAVLFRLPAPSATNSVEWVNASSRSVWLRPVRGFVVRLTNDPGASSGSWITDLEKSTDNGATWVSMFDSARRPEIAFGAATAVAVGEYPSTFEVESGAMLRARADAVASGGTPTAILAVAFLEVPR